jgi:hypothetical protein
MTQWIAKDSSRAKLTIAKDMRIRLDERKRDNRRVTSHVTT